MSAGAGGHWGAIPDAGRRLLCLRGYKLQLSAFPHRDPGARRSRYSPQWPHRTALGRPPATALTTECSPDVRRVRSLLRDAQVDVLQRAGELQLTHPEFAAFRRQELRELVAPLAVAESIRVQEGHGLRETRQAVQDRIEVVVQ